MEEELYFDKMHEAQYGTISQKGGEVNRIFRGAYEPNEKMVGLNILLVVYFHEKRYNEAMNEVTLLIENPDLREYKPYLMLKQCQIRDLQG